MTPPPPAFDGMTSLPAGYRAAVIGASGAIGSAFVRALEADPRAGRVWRIGRSLRTTPGEPVLSLDLDDEASIAAAAAAIGAADRRPEVGGGLHLLLVATGGLMIAGRAPEKALRQIDQAALAAQIALNAIGPALVLKHFTPLLARNDRALVAALSARVGSIGDNRLGGWIGYRAAKAALNQVLRTAAVELGRTRPLGVVAALHPGTVESPLSRPFRPEGADAPGVLTPEASATRLLAVLDGLSAAESGCFRDWKGEAVPW